MRIVFRFAGHEIVTWLLSISAAEITKDKQNIPLGRNVNWHYCGLLGMTVLMVGAFQGKVHQRFAFDVSFCVEPADIWTSSNTARCPSQRIGLLQQLIQL